MIRLKMINKNKKILRKNSFHLYRDLFKRILDIILCLIAIILFAIPMCVIAFAIKVDSPKEKILFKQKRIGKNGVPFVIYKFRSMDEKAPEIATENFKHPETYITPIGKVIRKTSLDELPQLFNVIKGEMSLVGPRPLIPKEKKVLSLRNEYGADKVLPGITGLAQVHGRDEVTDENKASYDGKYALKISFLLDISIIIKTVFDVLRGHGIHDGNK